MTELVTVPAAPVVPPFPTLGAPDFNQAAYNFGVAMPDVSDGVRAVAVTAHTNATAAQERATAAAGSATAAAGSATQATTNGAAQVTLAAGQVTLAAAQVGIATTKAGEASTSATAALASKNAAATSATEAAAQAAAALGYRNTAQTAATAATTEADRAAGYAEGIADGPVTSVNGQTGIVVLPPDIINIAYSDRAQLRANSTGTQALVDGLGLFQYAAGSTEPDDDESCFATATGRWLLQAAHWDLVDAWQLPEVEERDAYDEDEPLRFAASFAGSFQPSFTAAFASSFPASFSSSFSGKVLTGTAACAITSVASASSASFTGTVTGATVGDRVIATPPAELGATSAETGRLNYHAWVSAANTVTVMLTNASAAAATTNAAIRAAWPITVIKA